VSPPTATSPPPTPWASSTLAPSRRPRPSFPRWLRSTSEHQLLVHAQAQVARRNGLVPPAPKGTDVLWQKVYAPVFYALPYALRARVAHALPGSHRRTWHPPPQPRGPAV
jgi:hypothetical protein